MKAPQHGRTAKHSGSAKHVASKKHKPTHASAAQLAARKKWQSAGSKAHHVHTVAKHAAQAKAGTWTPNSDVACCVAEAMAVSLRLSGLEVSSLDVLELYWHTSSDPDSGATVEATLEAASRHGLAGVRLLEARPALELRPGVVLGLELAQRHVVTVDGHGVWTWGEWRPVSCGLLAAADEAWELQWAGVA